MNSDGWEGETNDDDVFFEMEEEDIVETSSPNDEGREGHLRVLPNCKMRNGFDIYVPETQVKKKSDNSN